MVRAHFHDSDFRVRTDAKNRQGNADVVVQVSLRGRDLEMCGQDLTDEFLGRRLTVRAGEADDRDVQLLPMEGREFLQRPERVREAEEAGIVTLGVLIDNGIGGTGLEGLHRIGVAVERFALQGDEKLARLDGPGVRIHALGGEEQGI